MAKSKDSGPHIVKTRQQNGEGHGGDRWSSMRMGIAYEVEETFDKDGQIRTRYRAVGGIVVWGPVVLFSAFLAGSHLPPAFWEHLKWFSP